MDRAWMESRPLRTYNETVTGWASQFERDQHKFDVKLTDDEVKQFQETYDKVADQGDEWAEEFRGQMTSEELEEEEWFNQFLPGGKFNTPSSTSAASDRWANEFQTQQSRSSHPSSDAWSSEFQSFQGPPGQQQSATIRTNPQFEELSNLVGQIPNPKLQNSRFMQFIRQVNDGQVQIPLSSDGNPSHLSHPPSSSSSSVGDSWAREFSS